MCDFTTTNNNDFLCTPIAPPATTAEFFEIKPALLNLVMREQFSGVSSDDAAAHLNNFVELCEMQKYKDVDGDIIKLKLFPFSLRGRAKDWLLSLPKNSIDSWTKCKDAFIGRYYPPAKIISLRSSIMNFKQLDTEHVAQAWERMKSLVKNCPTHGLTTWMIIQTFYAGLNFSSRNLLDSAAGGTFMSITLGAVTKLLDDMMINYSEWHTERSPQGKKVNSVEETSSLSDKIDVIMSMLVNGRSNVDPNNVPLASLVAQEEHVDVNFIKTTTSTTMLIGIILVATIISLILQMVMAILMVIPIATIEVCPLILKLCLENLLAHKKLSIKLLRKSLKKLMFLLLKLIVLLMMLKL